LRSGHEALTFLLFSASRSRKATTNDADRLRKYLNRFGIEWAQIVRYIAVLSATWTASPRRLGDKPLVRDSVTMKSSSPDWQQSVRRLVEILILGARPLK
jgi:hypothetical protein